MKKAQGVADLASRLTDAATTPLLQVATIAETPKDKPRRSAQKRSSVSVFLRLPPELFAQIDAEAVKRTKATGRGVTVQQVILDKLASSL